MRVSIITVCFNAISTIGHTLESVACQRGVEIEHIVIDGESTDGTAELLKANEKQLAQLLSEPDQGIYDAMNKGLRLATGDVVGLLNADDVLAHDGVLAEVVNTLDRSGLDGCYADLVYVDQLDSGEVVRYWKSNTYKAGAACLGWMPPHPTIYLKSSALERIGDYRIDIGPQADLEYCARIFEIEKLSLAYVPNVWVKMQIGGITNNRIRDILRGNWNSYLALRELSLAPNPISFFFQKLRYRLPSFLND
ncbi:MAG: glycosyltransferase [Proteobacteria bacterium]|jgi:glycosyltransferase involved in cell wall biosynthesis|nr:glycosyltransferase [Pseudomonadota bacterium]